MKTRKVKKIFFCVSDLLVKWLESNTLAVKNVIDQCH